MSTMRKIRFAFKILKIFLGVLACFILIVVVANLPIFDEELDPGLIASMQLPVVPPAEENAYIALYGISADEGIDMVEAGALFYERYAKNRRRFVIDDTYREGYVEILGQGYEGVIEPRLGSNYEVEWTSIYEECSVGAEDVCLGALSSNERFQLILSRYKQLIQMPYFFQLDGSIQSENYKNVNLLQQVSYLHLRDIYAHNLGEFISTVEKDMAFWRLVLNSQTDSLTKSNALNQIRENALLISFYILNNDIDNYQQIKNIIKPLTAEELDMGEMFKYENISYIQNISRGESELWQQRLLGQENAAKNFYYRQIWKPLEEFSSLSSDELYEQLEVVPLFKEYGALSLDDPFGQLGGQSSIVEKVILNCCSSDEIELSRLSPGVIYNLVGKMVTPAQSLGLHGVMLMAPHEVNGFLNLVNLNLEIAMSEGQDVELVIKNSEFINPFTREPMSYDGENRRLYFECIFNNQFFYAFLGNDCEIFI